MYVLALATDYDGTIAEHGTVGASTLEALRKFKETGRKLILVTGRVMRDLRVVMPEIGLFDRIVAENGALLYDPNTDTETLIAPAPPEVFVERLRQRKVEPLEVGRSIVATWEPNETTVLEVIQELGLELQIIFNKGAVMVLPSGINKAAGLAAALASLNLSPLNVVAVGDAENDHAFLSSCGCAAAVANALPMLKETANISLARDHGAGVIDLVTRICEEDGGIMPRARHSISIGTDLDGDDVTFSPFEGCILISGSSGIGKSTLATALTERMVERQIEFCVFDPEGDYGQLENAVSIGDAKTGPRVEEAVDLLRQLGTNIVFDTRGLDMADRPPFFTKLMGHIATMRTATGRPHWLLIDEAHHLMPIAREDVAESLSDKMSPAILITVHPESVAPQALAKVGVVITLGPTAADVLGAFCAALGEAAPQPACDRESEHDVLVWNRHAQHPPQWVKPIKPRQVHKRHTRKYAEGDLGEDRSFYFRGPQNALNLRAQNLMLFLQIAEGVDDATWQHHLQAGDYSSWFRREIKNNELAQEVAAIEEDRALSLADSRSRVRDAVLKRYTAPAKEEVEPTSPKTRTARTQTAAVAGQSAREPRSSAAS